MAGSEIISWLHQLHSSLSGLTVGNAEMMFYSAAAAAAPKYSHEHMSTHYMKPVVQTVCCSSVIHAYSSILRIASPTGLFTVMHSVTLLTFKGTHILMFISTIASTTECRFAVANHNAHARHQRGESSRGSADLPRQIAATLLWCEQ